MLQIGISKQELELSPIKAFAEVYGFELRRGIGYHAHEYQLLKESGGRLCPLCQYMEPLMLRIWIDGYESGRGSKECK